MLNSYPDGTAVATTYDVLGNAATLTDHDGTGVVYTRDAEGRVTKESHADGGTTEYDYNAAGLLTLQKEVTSDNATRRQIAYTYDDAGRLTSENRSGVGIGGRDELARYAYDKAGRLVRYTLEGAVTNYTYDRAGNLLSDGTNTYTYDVQNRLLTKSGADGTVNYTYDAVGNLLSDGTFTYAYNAQNKLVKGENADGESSSYTYNALGARIENVQVRENQNAGNQNADLTDGSHGTDYLPYLSDARATWQRVWESEVGTVVQNDFETVTKHYVADYLSPANRDILVTEDGSFTQRYVYDADGKRLSVELGYADGTARATTNVSGEHGENPQSDAAASIRKAWYRTSYLNSTLFAVEADGSVVAHMIYDPWGAPLLETYTDTNYSGLDNLNNFTGYAWDEVLGMYYAQNRFYDAATHRFTQEDAIKDGGNWYAYCGNDPLNYTDPNGDYYIKVEERNGKPYYTVVKEGYGLTIAKAVVSAKIGSNLQGAIFDSAASFFWDMVGGSSMSYSSRKDATIEGLLDSANYFAEKGVEEFSEQVAKDISLLSNIASAYSVAKYLSTDTIATYDDIIFTMFDRTDTKVGGYDIEAVARKMNNLYDFVSANSDYFFGRSYIQPTQAGFTASDRFWQMDLDLENAYATSQKKGDKLLSKYVQGYQQALQCLFNKNLSAYRQAYNENKQRLPVELQSANQYVARNGIISIMVNNYKDYLNGWDDRLNSIEQGFLRVVRGGV